MLIAWFILLAVRFIVVEEVFRSITEIKVAVSHIKNMLQNKTHYAGNPSMLEFNYILQNV